MSQLIWTQRRARESIAGRSDSARDRRSLLALAALCLTCIAMLTVGASSSSAAVPNGGTYANCPYGDVCIYPGPGWGGTPHRYYTYGVHRLYNQFGMHRVFNNQYGGAIVRLCTGSNGTGCGTPLYENTYDDVNLTPINSIVLAQHA